MKNKIDNFLEFVEKRGNDNKKVKRVLYKPNKFKALRGFVFSLLILIACIILFFKSFWGIVIIIFDLLILIYYGINLFTKNGLGIYKKVYIDEEEKE